MSRIHMHTLVVIINLLLVLLVAIGWFAVSSFSVVLVGRLLITGGFAEESLVIAGLAGIIGILSTPLSLLPSYKLSLKLAEWIEKKWGVAVDNPKKLFWLSLLIPIGVLILLSLISPS
ncbi:hypothetical protein KJ596_03420 [Patescibacteria group bacterium]|nr:hypothetical protein [Patescibacteria group bacterium]MBU1867936.1 hypothetical protein [Patescibacteria group bacterium]